MIAPYVMTITIYILIQTHKQNHVHHAKKTVRNAQMIMLVMNALMDGSRTVMDNANHVNHHVLNVVELMEKHAQNALMVII